MKPGIKAKSQLVFKLHKLFVMFCRYLKGKRKISVTLLVVDWPQMSLRLETNTTQMIAHSQQTWSQTLIGIFSRFPQTLFVSVDDISVDVIKPHSALTGRPLVDMRSNRSAFQQILKIKNTLAVRHQSNNCCRKDRKHGHKHGHKRTADTDRRWQTVRRTDPIGGEESFAATSAAPDQKAFGSL